MRFCCRAVARSARSGGHRRVVCSVGGFVGYTRTLEFGGAAAGVKRLSEVKGEGRRAYGMKAVDTFDGLSPIGLVIHGYPPRDEAGPGPAKKPLSAVGKRF